jgi:heme exporter protein A
VIAAPPDPGAGAPALMTRALVKRYGAVRAVDKVDLAIHAGESVLLLGPNGAGKSTLLRILATLIRPTAGTLAIFGEETGSADRLALRRRIGFLSHQTFLYDHLTGLENLEFYGRLYGLDDPEDRARAALRDVGLENRGMDLVRGFSRGMQQRLAIARAMLHDPEILLLDEPFTGLDRESSDRLLEALRPSGGRRRTWVMATHDFATGIAAAGRVVVLQAGRIVEDRPGRGLDAAGLEAMFRTLTRREAPSAGRRPSGPPA